MNYPKILNKDIGKSYGDGHVVLKGDCAFCNDAVTFRQIGEAYSSSKLGVAIAITCEGCKAIQIYSITKSRIYPESLIKGVENLPPEIDGYYQEALRCISHNCPNGGMTLFRKLIHQLGIHYGVAVKNDSKELYKIINELKDKGHIPEKLRKALLEVKDFGNDGAHVNENEPNINQCLEIKKLVDSVLTSSLIVDKTIEGLSELRKNLKK